MSLAITTSAFVCLAAAVEMGFRLLSPFPPDTVTYRNDRNTLYSHVPNSTGWEFSAVNEFAPVRLHYDRYGFRGSDFPPEKPSNEIRLLLLGDSFVEAREVSLENTIAAHLERQLNAAPSGRHYRVINAGVSAYTTTTEYLMLKHYGLQVHPDIVVAFFAFTDYSANFWYGRYVDYPEYPSEGLPSSLMPSAWSQPARAALREWLARRSAFFYFLQRASTRSSRATAARALWKNVAEGKTLMDSPKALFEPHAFSAEEGRLIQFTHDGIGHMRDLAAAHCAQLVYVVIPFPLQLSADEWRLGKQTWGYTPSATVTTETYQNRLSSFLRNLGVPTIDLLPVFRNATGVHHVFLDFNGHLSAYGQETAAGAIFRALHPWLSHRLCAQGRSR